MAGKSKTAKLIIGANEIELPIHSPSAGADVIDVTTLYNQAGVFTYCLLYTSDAADDQ